MQMQILRPSETAKLVRICDRHLRELEARGQFPKRFQIVPGGRAVGHLKSEVDDWVAARLASRDGTAA